MDAQLRRLAAIRVIVHWWLRRRRRRPHPIPFHTSLLRGNSYYQEILNNPNPNVFKDIYHIRRESFVNLLEILTNEGNLSNNPLISSGEKLMIFLSVLLGKTVRDIGDRFQHSTSTISETVDEVLQSFRRCAERLIVQPDENTPTPDIIRNDPRFWPFFDGCVGAFDGSYISAYVHEAELTERYRNRKGIISQNVFGAVNFDMKFLFVLAGWEGSAHDSRVLNDALTKGFRVLNGKFYLGDLGYALRPWCVTPFRGVRYHLKEFGPGILAPQNPRELFNLRHAMLRNVVERSWGALKKKFKVLQNMSPYPIEKQALIVIACAVLFNVTRPTEEWDYEAENEENGDDDIGFAPAEDENMVNWRNNTAQAMWENYHLH